MRRSLTGLLIAIGMVVGLTGCQGLTKVESSTQPGVALEEYAGLIASALRAGDAPVPWDQAAPTTRFAHAIEAFRAATR